MIEREILESAHTLAVVGASSDPAKLSHSVPRRLQRAGFRVIPVNPHAQEIWGERVYRSLREIPDRVDAVVVFRPAEEAPGIASQSVAIGAAALWLQSGLRSPEAHRIATEGGLDYVEDRCTAIERSRYGITKSQSAESR